MLGPSYTPPPSFFPIFHSFSPLLFFLPHLFPVLFFFSRLICQLADANFPSASVAAHTTLGKEIRLDGTSIPELLTAIMQIMPLDPVAKAGIFMEMMPEHKAAGWKTPVWDTYKKIVLEASPATEFEEVERFAFYDRSKKAFAVVATGETALYGNFILKKGIIGSDGK
jgi:L-fucose mutarotase